MVAKNCYEFSFATASGESLPLANFKGKVMLVVNTASFCGFTKQYANLEQLHKKFRDQGLVIIAVPSNDFGEQEPKDNQEIQSFCQINFGVSFLVVAKEAVKGPNAHPFYQWAKASLGFFAAPKWNFHKYLIGRDGKLLDYFMSTTSPNNPRVIKAIEAAL